MAILMFDGFEIYGSNGTDAEDNMEGNRWSYSDNIPTPNSTWASRTGNYSLLTGGGGRTAWEFRDNLGRVSAQQRWYGFGIRPRAHHADPSELFSLYDGGYAPNKGYIGTKQCYLSINVNGTLAVYNGDDTLQGTSVTVITVDEWQYWEVYVKIHETEGAFLVRVDGVPVLSLTNINTQNSPRATHDCFTLLNSNVATWYDDVYATDSGFLGPQKIYPIGPAGAGSYSQFARGGLDTGSNHSQVNELAALGPDDDTTYVYSSTASEIDSYTASDLDASITGDINAFQLMIHAKREVSGIATLHPSLVIQGQVFSGPVETLSTTGYFYHDYMWERNPYTGNQWTRAQINAFEIGVKTGA